jgi:hypothetical protein
MRRERHQMEWLGISIKIQVSTNKKTKQLVPFGVFFYETIAGIISSKIR